MLQPLLSYWIMGKKEAFKTELCAVLPSFNWVNILDQDESILNTLLYSSMKI